MAEPLLKPNGNRDKIISVRLSKAHEVVTAYLVRKLIPDAWQVAHEILQEVDKISPTVASIHLENGKDILDDDENGDDYKITE